jgi:hypothetical protein
MLRFVTLARLAQIKADAREQGRKEALAEVKEIISAVQPETIESKHAAAIQPVKKRTKRNDPATSSTKQGR